MTYDVNKIIEESVKDIIDSDEEQDVLAENENPEGDLDAQGSAAEEFGADFLDEKVFNESRDFLKEFVKEDVEGKK